MKRFFTTLKLSFFLCFLLAGIANTTAQTLYWVSGSGSWSEPSHWSLTSGGAGGVGVPTLANDVTFDKKSFTQPGATVTIDAAAYCNNLTWKGTEKFNPTLQGDKNTSLAVGGSLLIQDKIDNRFDGNIVFTANGEQKIVAKTPIKSSLLFVGTANYTVDEQAISADKVKILDGSVTASSKLLEGSKPRNIIQATGGPKRVVTTILATAVDVSCFGLSDGSLTVTVTGGSPNYTYQIADLSDFSYNFTQTLPGTVAVFSNIRAAQYVISVKDASGIAKTNSYLVEQPTALTLVATPINITCSGANDGKITATATGGTANYTYTLKKGGVAVGLPQTVAGSYTFTGLVAGNDYTVELNDANSCGPLTDGPFTIINPVALSGSVTTHTDILCFGTNTGSITAAATNGTPPYEYSIDGGTYQPTGIFNGLAAGNHTVAIRDKNLCSITLPAYTLTQPAVGVSGSISTQVNVKCNTGNDGSVTVAGAGGVGPYEYSLDGGAFQPLGTFGTLTAKGYTVTVKDVNGCTKDVPVTITQPTALGGSISAQTNVSCNTGNNGSVTVLGSGGTPPYEYSIGGPYQGVGLFGTLSAGGYTVVVRDANLCTFSVAVTITEPVALTGSISAQTNVACNGNNTGSVTVAGAGGTAPYQYSLNGGTYQAGGTFGTLAAGSHTVTIKDAKGCTYNVAVSITQPATSVDGSITAQVNVNCFGDNTGSVTVTGSGGTGPYMYKLNSGVYQASGTFGTLLANSYTVTVRDANLCTKDVAVTITQPATALTGSITTQVNVLCKGNNTGSVTVAGSGGTSPYQYSLNGGTYQASGTFGTLTANTYTVTVRDAKSCTKDVAVTITEPALGVGGSITSQTNVLCFGDNSGSVTVAGMGGTSPYQYSLNGGTYQASGTFGTLTSGAFTVTVKDNAGCTFNVIGAITQPANALTGSISSQTNVLCFGSSTGSVTVTGVNGTLPYSYSFQGGAYSATNTFSTLAPGAYAVSVKDAGGCLFNIPITITQPASALSASISSQTNVSCNGGNNGAATVVGAGGVAPYQYSLNSGTYQATGIFATLTADTYTVTVRDANLCTFNATVTITQPAVALTGSITSQTNIKCFNGNDGAVTVAGAGGTTPYEYSLNGGAYQAAGAFGTLTAGLYTVTVKDANSCTKDVVVTITQPAAAVTGSITSQTNLTCNGGNDGAVTVAALGGTTPYTYSIDAGVFGPSATFTNLSGIAHTVVIKDANGCTANVPVTLIEPAAINITSEVAVNVTGCFGNSNGSITITGSGGTGALSYSINGGTSFQASGSFINLVAGSYQVVVKDTKNCNKNGSLITITQPALLAFTFTTKDLSCNGSLNGEIHFTATGGTPPYQYSVLGGTATSWKLSPDFTALAAGTYSLKVKDANNCITIAQIGKIIQPAPIGTDGGTWKDVITCNGDNTGSITINVIGGVPPFSFSINGGTTWQPTGEFLNLFAGTYSVTVKDGNGCTTIIGPNTINEPSKIKITAEIIEDVTGCWYNTNGSIVVLATGGTDDLQFSIDGGVTWQNDGFFNNLGVGNYQVSIKDAKGCIKNGDLLTVAGPPAIVIDPTSTTTNVTCSGDTDGAINTIATGGTGVLTYSLNGGTYQATGLFTGLIAGTYTITVKDANDCTLDHVVIITEPDPIVFTSQAFTDITCSGLNNGTITITATGGTPPLSYSIDGGLTYPSTDGKFIGISAGSYTVSVKDAKGCHLTGNTYVITNPAAITITTQASTNSGCFGTSSGTITVTAAGGTNPLAYTLKKGATTVITQPNGSFTGLESGIYTVEVNDANSCGPVVAGPFTIIEAPELKATSTATNVKCNGDADGTITVTASGGTPPYTYSYDGGLFVASNTIGGLSGGSHSITVKDASNCEITISQDITEASILTISVTGTDPSCHGMTIWNGKVVATSTGGTFSALTPKLYRIDGGVWTTTPTFNNVAPGAHTVTVMDANNCTAIANVTLVEPTAVSVLSITTVDPTCTTLGTITVVGQGGSGTYTYKLNPGGATSVNGIFSGIGGGTYNVDINDSKGCGPVNSGPIVVVSPSTLIITSVDVVNVSPCFGGANGSLNINVAGATGTVLYSIDGGATWVTTSSFTNLSARNYNIQVNDDNNCITGTLTLVDEPAQIVLTVDHTVEPTPLMSDGEIHLTATGGTGTLTFTLNPGAFTNTTGIFTGLAAGTYSATVTDDNGCSATISDIALSDFTATITSTDVTCNGANDGTITINVIGTVNYDVQWTKDGLPYSTEMIAKLVGNVYKNLEPGVYVATVTDNVSLKVIVLTAVTITEPVKIIFAVDHTVEPTPLMSDGEIHLTASGGTGTLTFTLNPGALTNTTGVFTGLAAGIYTATVTDGNGCNVTITDIGLSDFTANITATDVTCNGLNDGTITITVTGTINFTINWTKDGVPYDTEMNAKYDGMGYKNLEPGTYIATVTDNVSLKVIVLPAVTISEPAAIIITNVVVGAPDICAGKNQGVITVEADPTGGPYEYSIDNGVTFVPTNIFINLPSGSYDVIVRVGACTVAWGANPIVLDFGAIPDPLVITKDPASVNDAICPDSKEGSIILTVSGGKPDYTYLWDNGSTSLNQVGLGKGNHAITVTDQNNCKLTSTFTIGGPDSWELTAVYDSVTCRHIPYGTAASTMTRGKIKVTVVKGATPAYIYDWQRISDDEKNLPPFQFVGNEASDLYPTTSKFNQIYYVVNVTDSKGCKYSETYTVPYKVHLNTQIVTTRMTDLVPVEYWDRDTACYNGHLLLSLDTLPAHRNFDSVFGWSATPYNLGGIDITNDSINPVFNDTTYIKAVVTKTIGGETCFDWDTLKVHLYPRIGVKVVKDEKFEEENTIVLPQGNSFNLTSIITSDNDHPMVFWWTDPLLFNPANGNQTTITIPLDYTLTPPDKTLPPPENKRYYTNIFAYAKDTITGCVDSSKVRIHVLKDIQIPNAFSPNGDGINDTWAIWDQKGVSINFLFPGIEVEVFNRWGSRVFYSKGYNKPWDGKSLSGKDLPVGTYYFVIKFNRDGYSGEAGSVTILR